MATGNQDPEFLTDSLILLQKRKAWEESSNCSFLVFLVESFFVELSSGLLLLLSSSVVICRHDSSARVSRGNCEA